MALFTNKVIWYTVSCGKGLVEGLIKDVQGNWAEHIGRTPNGEEGIAGWLPHKSGKATDLQQNGWELHLSSQLSEGGKLAHAFILDSQTPERWANQYLWSLAYSLPSLATEVLEN